MRQTKIDRDVEKTPRGWVLSAVKTDSLLRRYCRDATGVNGGAVPHRRGGGGDATDCTFKGVLVLCRGYTLTIFSFLVESISHPCRRALRSVNLTRKPPRTAYQQYREWFFIITVIGLSTTVRWRLNRTRARNKRCNGVREANFTLLQ